MALLAIPAWWLTRQAAALQLPLGIPGRALEYPIWAALLGLAGNALLKRAGAYAAVEPGLRMELFLKIGLVLLGASVNVSQLVSAAAGATLQGVILIGGVFLFCWWLGGRFGLDNKLRAVMSSAVAICGVSAAIAAAGSVLAKKEQVTYVTALVIVVALPLMVLAPLTAGALGLSETVAGAWFGGNIDTTAAVVGAGTLYGETAQRVASIVKSTQNALIGVVTFLLALYFSLVVERKPGERPSPRQIWERFPKFVLGFVAAAGLYSLGWIDGGRGTPIEALRNWCFTLAFVGMGLQLSLRDLRQMGWRPFVVFLITTLFNTLLALAAAWLIFGQWLPPAG
jgi:uncharacterized membrane protein YadS